MSAFYVLFCFNLLLLVSFLAEANHNAANERVHIVYMGASGLQNGATRNYHAQLLSELTRRNNDPVVHIYDKVFLGFAARLSDEDVKAIAERPEVVSVSPDTNLKLHTTRSWDFLYTQINAFNNIDSTPTTSHFADSWSTRTDTIIGIIDSGIWPESPSFNDTHMGPIPSRWNGTCMPGKKLTPITCNRKVIGARYYEHPDKTFSVVTARDEDGHGTYVASIAAGMPVCGASYYGLAKGTARGGSPGSRIAVYGVCGKDECAASSILKAFDDAIRDGVDVLSVSLGEAPQDEDIVTDTLSIGAFHAVEKGVVVVCSGSNDGPSPLTVANIAPWILTVGATTIDRDFEVDIVLGGGITVIKGGGINFSSLNKSVIYYLVDGRSVSITRDVLNASNCMPGSLDGAKVKDKIVLCESKDGPGGTAEKLLSLQHQGAIGMIVINTNQRQVAFNYGTYPVAAVSEEDGARIRSYINSTNNASAIILPTRVIPKDCKPAPVVSYFSGRGPPYRIQNLIKPDIAAPGVNILGAWRLNDTSKRLPGKEPPVFTINSGTSMSCPHVAGLSAIIKSFHPTWTPSAIKSAIMTTAIHKNNLYEPITTNNGSIATPYDMGSGEINMFGALWPGLVYETKTIDYVQFLCNMGYNTSVVTAISSTLPSNFSCPSNSSPDLISDMNYPSIVVSGLKANASRTVKRTVTNVGEENSIYSATVESHAGLLVQVVPNKLTFTKKVKTQNFQVKFTLAESSQKEMTGSITLSNGKHNVRSPFVVSNA